MSRSDLSAELIGRGFCLRVTANTNPTGKIDARTNRMYSWWLGNSDAEPFAVMVMVEVCGLLAVGCTAEGENWQLSCAVPVHENETVSLKP